MCKFCSRPRKEARHLARCIIVSLHEEEISAWVHNGYYVLKHNDTGIIVSAKDGSVSDGSYCIWMPFLQRLRLRRAARQRAIQITHNNFFKCQDE